MMKNGLRTHGVRSARERRREGAVHKLTSLRLIIKVKVRREQKSLTEIGAERKRVKTFATISEQTGLAAVANAEMIVRQPGGYTPAGGAVQKPNLHKKRFVDFFQRLRL